MKIENKDTTKQTEYIELQDENIRLRLENEELSAKVAWYEEQIRLNAHRKYGKSSEITNGEQLTYLNEAEKEADAKVPEPTIEQITYSRRKTKTTQEESFKNLPVETIEYRLKVEECQCPSCGNELHEMSEEVRRELKVIPASVVVVEHKRIVYSCRNCEATGTETPIITAEAPRPVIMGSVASPSAVAFVIVRKFVEAVPLYRQEQQFKNYGIPISRQTMSNWILRVAEDWLAPLYNRLHQLLLLREVLHADETTVQVLHEDGREAEKKSYMWLYLSGGNEKSIILYDYQTTRASKHPTKFLEGFTGYIHTDGYAGYNDVTGATLVGCFAHARRKFTDALKALPKDATESTSYCQEGLNFCNKLFELERNFADLTEEERKNARLEQSKPVLDAFLVWLKMMSPRVLPKSSLGTAILYCKNQWDKLTTYLQDGRLEISNNRAERSIKPFVIGRKNWLFSNTAKGAKASSITYSIIETAKANNLVPLYYLTWLFQMLPNAQITDISSLDAFMPWSDSIPLSCKSPI